MFGNVENIVSVNTPKNRMPLKSNDSRKYSDVDLSANSQSTSEYNTTNLAARSMTDIHQQVNPARKPNLAVPRITHHKLDTDKSSQAAVHEKVERLGTFFFSLLSTDSVDIANVPCLIDL